ncbi:G-protein coupled receptor GRL101 [Exaiptasia diaphana]|nr:G-protein coupled receptor GRL101 [Exaiptasia diaphana]
MFPRRLIWMDDDNTSGGWKEGQVAFSAITDYKLVIEGQTSNLPGLISIGALHTTEEYCAILPTSAEKACSKVFTNPSGIITSPCYPSYYWNNARCNSTIKAKQGHVIRLDIDEFELEMSTRCESASLDVYDRSTRIGRYCGISYPPIIQSTSNQLSVIFRSNAQISRVGFMATYRILKDCPDECECRKLSDGRIVVSSRSLNAVPRRLPHETSVVDLSFNKIIRMDKHAFFSLPSLHTLKLNMNFMKDIKKETWSAVGTLQIMSIGDNLISSIGNETFLGLRGLKALSLRGNLIRFLHVDAFHNNTELNSLYLHGNEIQEILPGLFRNQKKLRVLYLHSNKVETFRKSSFKGLSLLEKLTLNNNTIKESKIPHDAFSEMTSLKHLQIDSFILCCYAKKTIPTLITCESQGNGFSSCNDMLKSTVIRVAIWIQGLFASFGNLAVIAIWTATSDKKDSTKTIRNTPNVQSLLLRHLALADLLMGIYLLFIAIQDALWKGDYVDHDVEWRSGISCQIAGAISTLSSEVSILMLVVLTADRFNTIVFDFRAKRLTLKTARCLCLLVWIIGAAIAFTPLIATTYFHDETTGFSFYGRSTVCIPFQLSLDKPAGWEYSVAIFMAFNGVAFFFILFAYVAIFIKVQRSAKRVKSTRDSTSLGTKIMFIVLTDFCCWMPVIVLSALSLIGEFRDSTGQVYAVIAVFILPVNSSINPVIYTFSTPQARNIYHQLVQRLRTQFQKVSWKREVTAITPAVTGISTEGGQRGSAVQDDLEMKDVQITRF